jgi:CcmD family protein
VTTAEKYVTAAFAVAFALVLLYVVIIALKLGRLSRELDGLAARARERRAAQPERERRQEVGVG